LNLAAVGYLCIDRINENQKKEGDTHLNISVPAWECILIDIDTIIFIPLEAGHIV
jgi:hypothetical protein